MIKRTLILFTPLLISASCAWAATCTVTNCADSGPGSLRYAVASAEADGGGLVDFNITTAEVGYASPDGSGWVTNEASGAEWFRIVLPLSPISFTSDISIEGSSQPTDEVDNPYGPEIEIRSGGSTVFYFNGNNNKIDYLVLNSSANGIYIDSGNNNTITGCYIGTTATGEAQKGNTTGIHIYGGDYNKIGGTSTAERNIISGNSNIGIYLRDTNSTEVYGNYIGVVSSGTTQCANVTGVQIETVITGAKYNRIGNGSAAGKNIISGNTTQGIVISGSGTNSNEILGNFIGTDKNGTTGIKNGGGGVAISSSAKFNRIGSPGAAVRNIIASDGSSGWGITIYGSGTNSNEVLDNYIGTDVNGITDLGFSRGIYIQSQAKYNRIGNGTAGGKNIIAGCNTNGIQINGSGTDHNEILGNWVGLQSDGVTPLANGGGVLLYPDCQFNHVGSPGAAVRNIISGNSTYGIKVQQANNNYIEDNWIGLGTDESVAANSDGIEVSGASSSNQILSNVVSGNTYSGISISFSSNNQIKGNLIGLDKSGAKKSNNYGIFLSNASQNIIGGTTAPERNIVSGNASNGIHIASGTLSASNEIYGNYIGVGADGETPFGNKQYGIYVRDAETQNNMIGTSEAGGGNIIVASSESGSIGIFITASANQNFIYNNVIGLTSSESIPATQGEMGIQISGGANNNHIGGSGANEGNVVSGNTVAGIYLNQSSNNQVKGNLVGLDKSGNKKSNNSGIYLNNASQNRIGGTNALERNIISGNSNDGITLYSDTLTASNEIYGNYIGVGADGETPFGNKRHGIFIDTSNTQNNMIGTSEAGGGNIIVASSESDSIGITISTNANHNYIYNNIIGLTASESIPLTKGNRGILFAGGANNNHIGGAGANEGNVISGNTQEGIVIQGSNTNTNEVIGNYVGVRSDGVTDRGNTRYGIRICWAASFNTIGTNNIIAYNGDATYPSGIIVADSGTVKNVITQNSIFSNYGKGIELSSGGNNEVASPEVTSADHNEATGNTLVSGWATAEANGTVEIFKAEGEDGKDYLGSASVSGSGYWSMSVTGLVSGDVVVATGTTQNPETSEFSLSKEVITTVFKEYQPDNLIASLEAGTDYIGEGIFNLDGTNQTRSRSIVTGQSATYYIKIKNDANTSDEIIVKGRGSSGDWTLTYYDAKTGGTNITSSITGTGWSTGVLTSGESKEIRMIAANSGSTLSTLEALVTSESKTQTAMKDAVKAATTFIPSELSRFDVSAPSSAIALTPFSLTVTARKSTGATEEVVIGTTSLSVDSGTITPESIAESAFTNGIWTDNVTLSKPGARTLTVVNGTAAGTAEILVTNASREFSSSELGIAGMTISVPAGAATSEVTISVSEVSSPGENPPGFMIGGKILDIDSNPGEFLLPVTVTIPISGPLMDPHVYYWNGSAWSRDGITVISFTDNSLTFTTTHFTIFAPMGAIPSNLVRFGPNPYNPNSGTTAKIWYWLSADADTSIYVVNLTGTLVWKNSYAAGSNGGKAQANSIDFDGKDQWGNILGDGVYLYKIVQGGKSIGGGKIAIIKK